MYSEITDNFHFQYLEATDGVQLYVRGRQITPRKFQYGSRNYFKVGKFFVKAEYAHTGYATQCKDEIFTWPRIQNQDRPFFTRLLACSDVADETIHWVMYPWYELKKYTKRDALYEACEAKVRRLCDKYSIDDVTDMLNINWFIHKGKPLIVDYGCADGGSEL